MNRQTFFLAYMDPWKNFKCDVDLLEGKLFLP